MSQPQTSNERFGFSPEQLIALARTDFATFVELVFPILHDGKSIKYAPYIDFVCCLMMGAGQPSRLRIIVNMPPGYMKSLLISVLFVAWRLGVSPGDKFICASYGDDVAHKFGRMTRAVMQSPLYRAMFPKTVLTKTAEDCLETSQGGCRYATAVGSDIAGFRANYILIDDPMQPDEAHNAAAKQKVVDWYDGVIAQRLLANGVIIVVMHRLSPDDFCGTLEETGNWFVLKLPLIAEQDLNYGDGRGNVLWAAKQGDLLNPAYKNQDDVDRLRREINSAVFDAQCQQRPRYSGTGYVSIERLHRYDTPPAFECTIHSWDIAATKDGGDWTVCLKFGLSKSPAGDIVHLIGIVRTRIELPDVREAIIAQDTVDKPALIVIDGNGIGRGVLQDLKRRGMTNILPGSAMERSNAEGLKAERLRLAMMNLYDGRVRIPNAMTGLDGLLSELALFPDGKHDDQVDALAIIGASLGIVVRTARTNADRYGRWSPETQALLVEAQRSQSAPRRGPRRFKGGYGCSEMYDD
jgi:predicted phage terminase large subunit-like protein